jgi:hypothetical protein
VTQLFGVFAAEMFILQFMSRFVDVSENIVLTEPFEAEARESHSNVNTAN